MQLFRNKQMRLRMMAVAADSILLYVGFLFANQVVGGTQINIVFFLITALCGLFANLLPYNSYDKHKQSLMIGSIGLALTALSIGVSAIKGFNLFALPVGFIALALLYYRSYTSYFANILYVYSPGSFYKSAVLLFIINAAVSYWSRSFGMLSEELLRYSVLYVLMALYVLSELKNFRYISKSENSNRTVFDMAAPGFMIVLTLIMSVPKIFNTVSFPFVVVFKFIYGWIVKAILLITYPIAMGMNYLFDLIEMPGPEGQIKPNFDNMLGMSDKYKEAISIDSPLVQLIGKALAFIVMLAICAYATYLLYRYINKITRPEEEQDFVEEKEFILRGSKKRKASTIGKLVGAMSRAAGSLSFMLTADNRDKLRKEYQVFVQKLYSKKIISSHSYTAQDILQHMLAMAPNQKNELASITDIYEEVRYGTRYPEDNELKSFKRNIKEISKNIQLMQ